MVWSLVPHLRSRKRGEAFGKPTPERKVRAPVDAMTRKGEIQKFRNLHQMLKE
jgi:hypothetical protein